MNIHSKIFLFILLPCLIISCNNSRNKSSKTGWPYNKKEYGGFQVAKKPKVKTPPGTVFIEGGTFIMGSLEQDLQYRNDSRPTRVTVASFFMDETEVSNRDWKEYLYWTSRIYGKEADIYRKRLPDKNVWRRYGLAYNEPWFDNYFDHPAFDEYPIVGVSWTQATEYSAWRTDRINEGELINKGIQKPNLEQKGKEHFTTDAYLAGQYEGVVGKNLPDLDPSAQNPTRPVKSTDGILFASYRLPTEAEWEYAALSLIGNTRYENVKEQKLYPWNGYSLRRDSGRARGLILANFKRGSGDNSGVAGYKNDGYDLTAPVKSFPPNDFGLYNMAGNVNEWVLDVYRPLSPEEVFDYNPFRGNVYRKQVTDAKGTPAPKDETGHIPTELDKTNFENPDLRGQDDEADSYGYGKTSLINNKSRVYKGGSWNDRAYWLQPGTRRFLDEDSASAEIGFRCAMSNVGDPIRGKEKGKPSF